MIVASSVFLAYTVLGICRRIYRAVTLGQYLSEIVNAPVKLHHRSVLRQIGAGRPRPRSCSCSSCFRLVLDRAETAGNYFIQVAFRILNWVHMRGGPGKTGPPS